MGTKHISSDNSYLPVAWEYREVVAEEIEKKTEGKIFFFDHHDQVAETKGRIVRLTEEKNSGLFIVLNTGSKIRMDKIITLFGKIGAAYEAYNAYADSCMDCMGGYTHEELNNL